MIIRRPPARRLADGGHGADRPHESLHIFRDPVGTSGRGGATTARGRRAQQSRSTRSARTSGTWQAQANDGSATRLVARGRRSAVRDGDGTHDGQA